MVRAASATAIAAAMIAGAALAQVPVQPQLAIGAFHACAVEAAGTVRCWGDNAKRQLGDGTAVQNASVPREVPGLAGVAALAAGYRHTCALLTSGSVRCWGENASGQLGDGSFTDRATPVAVTGLSNAVAIAARNNHTCVLTTGGALRCWGENFYGQLGAGDGNFPNNRAAPVVVTGFESGTQAFGVGGHHTCALKGDGSLWCWGQNWARQLGTPGTTPPTDTPRRVDIPAGTREIALGWEHSCTLDAGGGVRCWGLNDNGQVGSGPPGTGHAGPTPVDGLSSGVASLAAGYYHNCAITIGGAMLCWGNNSQQGQGMLGDGSTADRATPQAATGLGSGMRQAAAGWGNTGGVSTDGSVVAWGTNLRGTVGDGTYIDRFHPQLVVRPGGVGFLDLTPDDGQRLASTLQPAFPVITTTSTAGAALNATTQLFARPQDVGRSVNLYVFALAPRELVPGIAQADGPKADPPLPCVLAQLTGTGQLAAVSASGIQALVSGVLTDKAQSLDVLRNVSTGSIAGATFFVGYGASSSQMLDGGTNRGVVSVPGTRECKPQPPQTGWWWNPAEGGRGYSIESSGNRLWVAAFLYDASGRSSWHVFGGVTALDGALFTGKLYSAQGGQSLGGAYRKPAVSEAGDVTIAFSDATHGTLVWPGGVVPIERFDIVPGGRAAPTAPTQPEAGWWWNPDEDGRGFFIEWQNGSADLAGYMYDAAGNPVWYLTVATTPDLRRLQGSWWEYANGQAMGAAYRPAQRVNDNVAPVTIEFTGTTEAVMTLPGGRTTRLTRYRF